MAHLLPPLPPEELAVTIGQPAPASATGHSDVADEALLLFGERETEKAGGVSQVDVSTKACEPLREALAWQLEEVRTLLRNELAKAGEQDVCLTCSFQAEDVVLLYLAREQRQDIPVLFLDTGYHFAETYEYRDRLAKDWALHLTNLLPQQTVEQQEGAFGLLYQTEPNRCCGLRKVEPLFAAVGRFEVWLTGLRREQARSRTELKVIDDFQLPSGRMVRKVSPLADWTTRDVWQLAAYFDIPLLPLYDAGYTSIGCQPCTTLPTDPNDPRSGRWAGKKVECGIHIQSVPDLNATLRT